MLSVSLGPATQLPSYSSVTKQPPPYKANLKPKSKANLNANPSLVGYGAQGLVGKIPNTGAVNRQPQSYDSSSIDTQSGSSLQGSMHGFNIAADPRGRMGGGGNVMRYPPLPLTYPPTLHIRGMNTIPPNPNIEVGRISRGGPNIDNVRYVGEEPPRYQPRAPPSAISVPADDDYRSDRNVNQRGDRLQGLSLHRNDGNTHGIASSVPVTSAGNATQLSLEQQEQQTQHRAAMPKKRRRSKRSSRPPSSERRSARVSEPDRNQASSSRDADKDLDSIPSQHRTRSRQHDNKQQQHISDKDKQEVNNSSKTTGPQQPSSSTSYEYNNPVYTASEYDRDGASIPRCDSYRNINAYSAAADGETTV